MRLRNHTHVIERLQGEVLQVEHALRARGVAGFVRRDGLEDEELVRCMHGHELHGALEFLIRRFCTHYELDVEVEVAGRLQEAAVVIPLLRTRDTGQLDIHAHDARDVGETLHLLPERAIRLQHDGHLQHRADFFDKRP